MRTSELDVEELAEASSATAAGDSVEAEDRPDAVEPRPELSLPVRPLAAGVKVAPVLGRGRSSISADAPSSVSNEHWQMRKGKTCVASTGEPSWVMDSSTIRGGARPSRASRLFSNAAPEVGS